MDMFLHVEKEIQFKVSPHPGLIHLKTIERRKKESKILVWRLHSVYTYYKTHKKGSGASLSRL